MNVLPCQFLVLILASWVNRAQPDVIDYLQKENRDLREQLGSRKLIEIGNLVTRDTLLRWHRDLVAKKYDGSKKRGPGRPRKFAEIERLILEMAGDIRSWGYTRIKGTLHNLGFEIGRNTIKRVLIANGIDPTPMRRTTWRTFLKAHWGAISTTDFLAVEIITWRGLVRYLVLFLIDLKTRRIVIAGMSSAPDGQWVAQLARNLTAADRGFLKDSRYLIHDRDPLFANSSEVTLESSGVRPIRLTARSPNLNVYAERFVRSIKSECLAQVIPLGERHIRHALKEYTEHYHRERNDQGLDNELINPHAEDYSGVGSSKSRERLGGLLRHYRRAA